MRVDCTAARTRAGSPTHGSATRSTVETEGAILLQVDSPVVAAALAAAASADAATAAEHDGLRKDREQLDDLAELFGEGTITRSEWLAARKPIQERIDAAQRK